MGKPKYLVIIFLLGISFSLSAQNDFSAGTWHFIDSSIAKKAKLGDLLLTVNNLGKKAWQEQKYFYAARCLNYRMLITDLRTEDTLYFKNSSFIDSLLVQTGLPEDMQYSLHMMQARRVKNFIKGYKKFQQNRYERKDLPVNYAAFSNLELDSIVQQHFEKAKLLSKQARNINIDEALWLSSDPLQFLYKPELYDIAIAEQIAAIDKMYYYQFDVISFYKTWLELSQDGFISKLGSTGGMNNFILEELKLYKEWISYHQTDPSAYYFIETLARKNIYEILKPGYPEVGKIYEKYLKKISASPLSTVKAFGVYQLCLLWNSQGKKYFPLKGYEYDYSSQTYRAQNDYDTVYRYHPAKALQLFQQNKLLFDSFAYLKNILWQMEEKIRDTALQFSIQEYNLPGEPMLAELKFKNAEKIYYRIVRINKNYFFKQKNQKELIGEMMGMPVVIADSFLLPHTDDYNYHNTYLKLDVLPEGHYVLLFADKELTGTHAGIQSAFFKVSNIAVINSDKRIYILNRKTGFPLSGAKVQTGYIRTTKKDSITTYKYVSENYTVNDKGFVTVGDNDYKDFNVFYDKDSISEQINIAEKEKPEDVYTKDEYDGLVDYYEENAKAYIYTDRSIYRPGQTVFYKAIFITKNKDTGEPMVMNRQNLKGKLFGGVFKKWRKESEPVLIITDPFNREMDSLKIIPNEFGSVSGSFKIPKTAATGDWDIEPDYIDRDWNSGNFKVEEYKRPSYEITIEKSKKELRVSDEFSFKVKVKSFAGATLSNVRINYSVQRSGLLPVFDSIQMKMTKNNISVILFDSTGYTNAEGESEITVKDSLLKKYDLADSLPWNFDYAFEAEAIDATGESYSADSRITVSTQPVRIKLPLVDKYNRQELPELLVTAEDKNAGSVNKIIRIRFFRLDNNKKLYDDRKLTRADEWLYAKPMLTEWFPLVNFYTDDELINKKLTWETTVNTGEKEKISLPPDKFMAGNYIAEAVCIENGETLGVLNKNFTVFDAEGNNLPEQAWSFYHLPYNSVSAGDSAKYYFGSSAEKIFSIFHMAYYSGNKKTEIKYFYEEQVNSNGIHQYNLKIPGSATDYLKLTQLFIISNQVFTHEERFEVINNATVSEPEIIIEKYRKKLSPGSKEAFTVSIKTKNENIAAELMTTMYDASLDKLEKHKWERPVNRSYKHINTEWPQRINSISVGAGNQELNFESILTSPGHPSAKPLWWVNQQDYAYTEIMGDWNFNERARRNGGFDLDDISSRGLRNGLSGRVAGLNVVSDVSGLNEVVVTAYGIGSKRELGYSVSRITVRGISSLTSYNQPLIILDGVIIGEGDLSKIDPALITQAMILKGADATALYGSRASQGVLVLSTKGDIIFPKEPEPIITPRKNFNELAFFFPAIHADKNGFYSFSFTMPETVTEWNWKMLAHTKLAQFAYAERKLNTQLPLMVQPNMPRLLYQGDRIVLQNRISSLDTLPAAGKIVCKIEDAVTGNDITDQLVSINQHDFSLGKKENSSSAFEIKIPVQQLNPLKVIITVRSGNFADGEEHILPVLSAKVFVRDSKPFSFQNNPDTILPLPSLPKDAEMYGIGLSILPKPQAALINSLPWLANYPYGCAEQTFNKLLAYTTALKIMQTDKTAQQVFEVAKNFVEKGNEVSEKLPDELNEETMPWLNKTNKSSLQQKGLFDLLDTSKTKTVIDGLLQKLYKFQNTDGGLTWFNGGNSNFYISSYVLRGLGMMQKESLIVLPNSGFDQYNKFIQNLVIYTSGKFIKLLNEKNADLAYYIYARSYWQKQYPVADSLQESIRAYLGKEWKYADKKPLYDEALLAIASFRFAKGNNELFSRASEQLNSIRQLAISDEQNGTRWKEIADADNLDISSEETIALLTEAFEEQGNEESMRNGIVKWLLTAKKEDNWGSTKATAAAINLLLKKNNSVIGETQTINTSIDNKKILVNDDLLKGSLYAFSSATSFPSSLLLKKEVSGIASGNLCWYYFTTGSSLSYLNKDVRLSKELFKWNEKENKWDLISDITNLKIADRVKVVLTIISSKSLPYVFIDDKRAAAFEPADNNSGYEYGSGFSYYRSVRDAGCQFFAENIPSGRNEISYELKVSQEGNFTSGPAVLQCMYKPEINAFSNSSKIVTAH